MEASDTQDLVRLNKLNCYSDPECTQSQRVFLGVLK